MKLYLSLALGGIPIGAMYALQALGIVIVYKTSKVFNFAAGAIGLTCAYFGSTLHEHGFAPAAHENRQHLQSMFFKGARAVRDPKKTGRSAERVGHAYFLEGF